MKARLLHLGIAGPAVLNSQLVETALNSLGIDWLRVSSHVWVLYTDQPIDAIRLELQAISVLGEDAFLLFTSFDPFHADTNGWLPGWAWDWFRAKPL